MEYDDFGLTVERRNDHYQVQASSRLGRARIEFRLPFGQRDIKDVIDGVGETIARRRRAATSFENRLEKFGQQLFDSLFQAEVLTLFNDAYAMASREDRGLRVKLNLLPPELAALPWEFMYNPTRNFRRFLALLAETAVIRHVEDAKSPRPIRELLPPLRILGMVARPRDLPPLDWAHEKQRIEKPLQALIDSGQVWIDWLEAGTLGALRDALSRRDHQYLIFHFVGHGHFDERRQEGLLLFEGPDGLQQSVDGEVLGLELFNHRYLRLAFLNACQSAQTSLENPFAGVAPALVRAGIPAVAAMQFALTDDSAAAFSYQFYHSLSQGHPVEAAVASARMALFPRRTGEWAIPVLYLSIPGEQVFPFTYDLSRFQDRVDALLNQRRWPEAIRLCTLMRTLHPHRHSHAQALELLARAHVQIEEEDWHEAHDLAVRGHNLTGDLRFQALIDQAKGEAEIADTFDLAVAAFKARSPIEALRRCEEILNRRPNHPRARALRSGIEIEDRLGNVRKEIEAIADRGEWEKLSGTIAPHLAAAASIDRGAAGVVFPTLDLFADLAELAELQVRGDLQLAAGRWEEAEATYREICDRWPDHCPHRDLLYAEAKRLVAASGQQPDAIERLKEIEALSPGFRDTADVLRGLEDAQEQMDGLCNQFEAALEGKDWSLARKLCREIARVDPSQLDAGAFMANLDQAVAILECLQAPLVADPFLVWQGGFPYTLFSRVGITPASSMHAVRDASLDLQESGMTQEERRAYDALRSVIERLAVDAFLYSVDDLPGMIDLVEETLVDQRTLPSPQQALDALGDDAPVLLVAMGERQEALTIWQQAQYRRPYDGSLAHRLALLATWSAQAIEQGDDSSVQALWSTAIGNWAMILEDRAYWPIWAEDREECYGDVVASGHVVDALQGVRNLVQALLAHEPELELAFEEELAAVRLMQKAGGIPVPGQPGETVACGPRMLATLDLQPTLADLIAEHSVEATDIVDLLKRTAKIDWSPQVLRRRFSSLTRAATLIDRSDFQAALEALADVSCRQCPPCDDADCPTHHKPGNGPRLCCARCPRFDRLNPAYTRLPDPAGMLRADAADLAIMAHLGLAEAAMARRDAVLDNVRQHWLAAIGLAEEFGSIERVKGTIMEKTLGRIGYLFKEGDEDDEGLLAWTTQVIDLADLAVELVGEDSRLSSRLARALTMRGIRLANTLDVWGAEGDLRRAFGLNPGSLHTRHQFAVALTVAAKLNRERDRWTSAQMLREAEAIVVEGLESDPDHEELQEQLEDIRELQSTARKEPEPPKAPQDPWEALRKVLSPKKPTTLDELASAYQRDPSSPAVRSKLISALVDYSERLAGKGERAEAMRQLEEWLPEFPEEERLQLHAAFLREGYRAEGYLRKTGLKHRLDLWERNTFHLPFSSEFVPDLEVLMQVVGDVAVISAPLPPLPEAAEGEALMHLLGATEAVPLHKICSSPAGQALLVAEIPVSLLAADILEQIIRTTSRCADLEAELLLSSEELKDRFKTYHEVRQLMQPLHRLYHALSGEPLPAACTDSKVAYQTLGDGRFRVGSQPDVEIVAHCTDFYAHFALKAGRLRAKSEDLFRRLAAINGSVRLCKVVLDPHLEVIFRVDLPGLSPETLIRAVTLLEEWPARFVTELVG